ncbi:uncharacterized protein J7T54_000830 [Emericellopsis cladophorae]|uniref:Mcm2 3 5 family protein n=1 Tax=Emericellopsis cladophorae TaxID=2686198 RepID=A0A9Q0BE94_9HYPO|nr:uncharacterized protein J7T54_000830 [Emericellopsis cladophorae]KAI6782687.1 hypothetical protein J7T54_000830 [Emericellopsis cladophorae]
MPARSIPEDGHAHHTSNGRPEADEFDDEIFHKGFGQVLTRRSILRGANGMTLGEMTMRNWVIQPGSLITHAEAVPTAGFSILGAMTLTATVAATFYTTASDAMVAPKLKYGGWESKELTGLVRTSYANPQYVAKECPSLLNAQDEPHAAASCSNVLYSGASYRNLLKYMSVWTEISENGTGGMTDLKDRPAGTTLLFDNTTMEATWIETEHSSMEANFATWDRVINNVTMAMPHPGVYAAATDEANSILQPDDLAGVGEYMIRAGVVSPSINVMCVNMNRDELAPLVYTEWLNAETDDTGVGDQKGAAAGWESTIPSVPYENEDNDAIIDDSFLNSTAVDDVFRWGQQYYRYPPVFPMLPSNYNMITNSSVYNSSSIYILAKSPALTDFTLCELNSWTSPNCSTRFDISGTAGARITAHCEDANDRDSFIQSFDNGYPAWGGPSKDWKWLADAWRLSMDLNGGVYNNNASNARIITQLALQDPSLPKMLPSMAEALAVYASSTLVSGAIDSPFVHYWEHNPNILDLGVRQAFNASIRTQQYTSGHANDWQAIFYVILSLVFVINLFCLGYFVTRSGLVTDFTEPQNLFALAVNSPPSEALKGTCGGGPGGESLVIPWRVAYAPSANHYFFEEAERKGKTKAARSEVEFSDRVHPKSVGTNEKNWRVDFMYGLHLIPLL